MSAPAEVASPDHREQPRVIGAASALGICIASMIGSGIFFATGEVGASLVSSFNVIFCWIAAGAIALAGAITLAELAAMRPRASAQYVVVHEALGAVPGYLSGMITLLIGYLASTAAVALVAGNYVQALAPGADPRIVATLLLLGLGAIHAVTVVGGSRLNDLLVVVKVAVVLLIVVAGFWTEFTTGIETILPSAKLLDAARLADPGGVLASIPTDADRATVEALLRDAPAPSALSAACGAAVIAITFAYLGWSNAADVAGEVTRPGRNVPIAVIGSVVMVGTLYILANVVYLWTVPPVAMVEVAADGGLKSMTGLGSVVAVHLFGERGGWIITAAIVLLMASTLSVGIMTCGRVIAAMAWKGELPRAAGTLNRRGAPTPAILAQIAIAIAMVWISGIRSLLEYVGVLTTFAVILTMLAAMVLRARQPDEPRPFRMPLYPLPPLVAIGVGAWIVTSSAIADWRPAAASVATVAAMLLVRPLLRDRAAT
jgi:APA family basic amino acid/polyamine antiporter